MKHAVFRKITLVMDIKIIIDPVDDILYTSFYVYGLENLFGKGKVFYSSDLFTGLSWESRHSHSMRFVVDSGNSQKKYVVYCGDSNRINEELYDWCDVYGSVNANFAKTSERYHQKLVSLCPSFGVRCWNAPQTWFHAIIDWPGSKSTVRKFLGKHKRLLQRPKYEDYLVNKPQNDDNQNKVFFMSTLWYNDEWNRNDEGVNRRRADFIRACKELEDLNFEGGLVSQGKDRSSEDLFADCLCKGVPMLEWMEKTKQSALVFNTPAFWDCHGWKLGEYLAMGKCIVSTKLSNDLPAPLEHGKHVHFVENSRESMREAVSYIMNHPEYRIKLENGARSYWHNYGTPIASLKLLGIGK